MELGCTILCTLATDQSHFTGTSPCQNSPRRPLEGPTIDLFVEHCSRHTRGLESLSESEEPKIRCSCCNAPLTNYETSLKHVDSGEYLDTCTECLGVAFEATNVPIDNASMMLFESNTGTNRRSHLLTDEDDDDIMYT
jgi:hypothetical protein